MKKFELIIIDARRWFDRVHGNTYHSVTVTVKHAWKDDLVLRCDFAYGYTKQEAVDCMAFNLARENKKEL